MFHQTTDFKAQSEKLSGHLTEVTITTSIDRYLTFPAEQRGFKTQRTDTSFANLAP